MRTALLIIALLLLLGLALALGGYLWWRMSDVAIGLHGLIALLAGAFASLLLGGGLMSLVFYSSRHGYDDAASEPGGSAESGYGQPPSS
ncbi:MAG TPA: hypothetical protein VLL72_03590 [Kiloniellales bacterium]|nr:hypothetical protein [Kiloniellales bacterium]